MQSHISRPFQDLARKTQNEMSNELSRNRAERFHALIQPNLA